MTFGHLYVFSGEVSECSAHLLIGFSVLMLLSIMSCLQVLETNPFSITLFANISCQSVGCLFVLYIVSFAMQKLLSLSSSNFLFLFFIHYSRRQNKKDILL